MKTLIEKPSNTAVKTLTPEEYFELSEVSDKKIEYYYGTIIEMPGVKRFHNKLTKTLLILLSLKLSKSRYECYHTEVMLEVQPNQVYYFPDVFISDEYESNENPLIFRAPILIIEVLSPSTARFDKGEKRESYQTMGSLQYYLLVEQERREIIVFTREAVNQNLWEEKTYIGSETIDFPLLNVSLSLDEIYEDLPF